MKDKILFYKELIENYCREKESLGVKRKFTLRGLMFYKKIPREDLGKLTHALKLLKEEEKIVKTGKKLWQWNGKNE